MSLNPYRVLIVALCLLSSQSVGAHQNQMPEGWRLVNAQGRFSFYVPADLKKTDVHGIDSYVEQYRSATIFLSFDYGQYSSTFNNDDGALEYTTRKTNIDGRIAKIVTYTFKTPAEGFKYFAGVYFSDVGTLVRGVPPPELSIGVSCKTREDQKIALQILNTIRFPPPKQNGTPNKSLDASGGSEAAKSKGQSAKRKEIPPPRQLNRWAS